MGVVEIPFVISIIIIIIIIIITHGTTPRPHPSRHRSPLARRRCNDRGSTILGPDSRTHACHIDHLSVKQSRTG